MINLTFTAHLIGDLVYQIRSLANHVFHSMTIRNEKARAQIEFLNSMV
ncbi:MAG: hypothetical protein ACI87Q_002367 [Pseudohongiellaceae bacterium]